MEKAERKEVTTSGSERTPLRRRPRDRKPGDDELALNWDQSNAVGLHDDALVEAALQAWPASTDGHPLIQELETRFGMEGAAQRLSAEGPQGRSLAIEHWGQWLGPEAFMAAPAMPAALEPRPLFKRRPGAFPVPDAGVAHIPGNASRRLSTNEIQSRLSGGRPLEGALRRRLETRLGADLGDVRIHADAEGGQLSRDLGARAFTLGSDIAFAPGEFQPGTPEGDRLIIHELVHVLQQRAGQTPHGDGEAGRAEEERLERSADQVSARATAVGAIVDPEALTSNASTPASGEITDNSDRADGSSAEAVERRIDAAHLALDAIQNPDRDEAIEPDGPVGEDASLERQADAISDQLAVSGMGSDRSAADPAAEMDGADEVYAGGFAGLGRGIPGLAGAGMGEALAALLGLAGAGIPLPGLAGGAGTAMKPVLQRKPAPGSSDNPQNKQNVPTPDIEAETAKARSKGRAQAKNNAKPIKPAEKPAKKTHGSGGDHEKPAKPTVKPEQKRPIPQRPPMRIDGPEKISSFQEEKSGGLRDWDNEVAWHEFFSNPGAAGKLEIDRGALVKDAVLGGMGEGFKEGVRGLVFDTLINVASSKIPMLSGFVEMAKIAYDPRGYVKGIVQNTYAKAKLGGQQLAGGFGKLAKGDIWGVVDVIEGFVNVVDGINGVIGTISSVLWIVAAAGFVLSFICPALIPLVAFCSQWALTFGAIGTLIGLWVTAARFLVMGLRALQIMVSEASPEELLEQGERLRAQSRQFAQEATQNAGHSLRSHGANAIKKKLDNKGGDPPNTQQANTATERPSSRLEKAVSLLSGMWGTPGQGALGGARGQREEAGSRLGTAVEGTKAFLGVGPYKGMPGNQGGRRTTGQQIADMEQAGVQVFTGDTHRNIAQKNLEKGRGPGARPGDHVSQRRDGLDAAADAHVARTQKQLDDAEADLQKSQHEQRQAQIAADRSRAELERIRQSGEATIERSRRELAIAQDLKREVDVKFRSAREEVDHQRRRVEYAEQVQQAKPNKRNQKRLEFARKDLEKAQLRVKKAHEDVKAANSLIRDQELNIARARQRIENAQQTAANRQEALTRSGQQVDQSTANRTGAQNAAAEAKDQRSGLPRGGATPEADAEAKERRGDYRLLLDVGGEGPSNLHGHNQASGVLGGATDLARALDDNRGNDMFGAWAETNATDPATGQSYGEQGIAGVFNISDQDAMAGAGGARKSDDQDPNKRDYRSQLQAKFDQVRQSLPPVPQGAPQRVDRTAVTYHERVQEEAKLKDSIEVLQSIEAQGKKEATALDVLQKLSESNEAAAKEQDKQLDAKEKKQRKLHDESVKTTREGSKASQKSGEGSSMLDGVMGGVLRALGMVPSSLGPGSSAAGGVRKMGSDLKKQKEISGKGTQSAEAVTEESERMTADTRKGRNTATTIQGEMVGLKGRMDQKEAQTEHAVADVQDAIGKGRKRMTEINSEKRNLRAEHDQTVASMVDFIEKNHAARSAGTSDIDAIVKSVPA